MYTLAAPKVASVPFSNKKGELAPLSRYPEEEFMHLKQEEAAEHAHTYTTYLARPNVPLSS